ncbi:ABC-type antimicrobial peptide transport system, ATPase component [Leptolyngbyaceae cyanobacterium JSC-12]|nr:ABC-type antimicrobial peptide transport system, ATPase component [Leptolyngbyaceae cyanobacterium JSC-12]
MTASQINIAEFVKSSERSASTARESSLSHLGSLERVGNKAVVARGIEMTFQSGIEASSVLQGVELEIPYGEIQLLMGPSGSGKTTLLSILAGILTPTAGTVHLLGQNITQMTKDELSRFRLKNIGFIFQGFNLFPALTAAENVEVALRMKGIKGAVAKREATDLLYQVGLGNRVNYLPRDLSGGQKQRVAIARALAGNPRLIMADEPTASLDSHSGHTVIELLRDLAKESNRTVLIVTHDPRLVDVADRVTHLEDGILKN